jgi:hypothetical protein
MPRRETFDSLLSILSQIRVSNTDCEIAGGARRNRIMSFSLQEVELLESRNGVSVDGESPLTTPEPLVQMGLLLMATHYNMPRVKLLACI